MDLLRQYSNCLAGARMFYQDALAASSPTASALLAQRSVMLYDQALSISDVIYDTLHPEISATEKERFIAVAYMQKNLNKASTAARQEAQQLDFETISGIRSFTEEEMKVHKERAKTLYMGIAGVITQKMVFDVSPSQEKSLQDTKERIAELESLLATDTEPLWTEADVKFLKSKGIRVTHKQSESCLKPKLMGRALTDGAGYLKRKYGLRGSVEELAQERRACLAVKEHKLCSRLLPAFLVLLSVP